MEVLNCSFESMGTSWEVTVFDDIPENTFLALEQTVRAYCAIFDQTYSRFIQDSLVVKLSHKTGICEVPPECTQMLHMYYDFYRASDSAFTPLVGDTLSDMGYDAKYSLKPKKSIRKVPDFLENVLIVDSRHIELKGNVTIDFGALGKGFAVDAIAKILEQKGISAYLVNGSGDIRCKGDSTLRVGLEHPLDASKVIGVVEMKSGSMCSSAINRRSWQGLHHIISPSDVPLQDNIIASWVMADSAATADGLATALFLAPPEKFKTMARFEYLLLDSDMKVNRSSGFAAELY